MKQLTLLLTMLLFCLSMAAQTVRTHTHENYVNEAFKGINIEMSDYREINSGSKIIVTYEGDWPAEMQGAFEYAVKIWEEVLPMTLPIRVTARIESIRGSRNLLSKVALESYEYNGELVRRISSPTSMIKSVLLQEYHSSRQHKFYDEIESTSFLDEPDFIITYNKNMLGKISYSLDGTPNESKFDFVTVVLRDIAIGLGFTSRFTADPTSKELDSMDTRLTPFETIIMEALKANGDPKLAFTNATKGSVDVTLKNWAGSPFGQLSVYAPQNWENGKSLHYLIPKSDQPISQLLTYDFGTGYIFRDLSGADWDKVFCGALDWRREMAVGASAGEFSQIGSTDDVLPYKGSVSLNFNSRDRAKFAALKKKREQSEERYTIPNAEPITKARTNEGLSVNEYCKKYNLYSPDGPDYNSVSLSVMKKDGSWDCVYTVFNPGETININIESLTLHYGESEYARGITGGLRYRLTKCIQLYNSNTGYYYDYETKYFTRDYTPQKAMIKFSPEINSRAVAQYMSPLTDDYFIDVEVGISNIEGTTKVVVEQLDEGERLPFQYEVTDFRKGSFTANLDRELSTTLTVICYNENGYTRSNTITIPAQGYPDKTLIFRRINDLIYFDGISARQIESGELSYTIQNAVNTNTPIRYGHIDNDNININDLPSGIYILTVMDDNSSLGNHKFVK